MEHECLRKEEIDAAKLLRPSSMVVFSGDLRAQPGLFNVAIPL